MNNYFFSILNDKNTTETGILMIMLYIFHLLHAFGLEKVLLIEEYLYIVVSIHNLNTFLYNKLVLVSIK